MATEALTQFLALGAAAPADRPCRGLTTPVSRRVLEKCGFVVEREVENPQGDGVDEVHLRLT